MNLVKQLPMGLGLACVMMLSSCSKEDAQVAPQHSSEQISTSGKNLKVRGPVLESSEQLAGWSFNDVQKGISNYKQLFGDSSTPWEKSLPIVFPGPTSFLTVRASGYQNGWAITHMQGLIPGKKYKVNFKVSTSRPYGKRIPYAATVGVFVFGGSPEYGEAESMKTIDLSGKQGQWVSESFTFVAQKDKHPFNFYTTGSSWGYQEYTYLNILIEKDAIVQLN